MASRRKRGPVALRLQLSLNLPLSESRLEAERLFSMPGSTNVRYGSVGVIRLGECVALSRTNTRDEHRRPLPVRQVLFSQALDEFGFLDLLELPDVNEYIQRSEDKHK